MGQCGRSTALARLDVVRRPAATGRFVSHHEPLHGLSAVTERRPSAPLRFGRLVRHRAPPSRRIATHSARLHRYGLLVDRPAHSGTDRAPDGPRSRGGEICRAGRKRSGRLRPGPFCNHQPDRSRYEFRSGVVALRRCHRRTRGRYPPAQQPYQRGGHRLSLRGPGPPGRGPERCAFRYGYPRRRTQLWRTTRCRRHQSHRSLGRRSR